MVSIIHYYIFFGITVLIFGVCFLSIRTVITTHNLVNKHKNYMDMLSLYLDKAYEIIYKNQIAAYSSEAVSPPEVELETIKRNYVKFCRELMGSEIEKILIGFLGSEKCLTENILLEFQLKYDEDELLKIMKIQQVQNSGGDIE